MSSNANEPPTVKEEEEKIENVETVSPPTKKSKVDMTGPVWSFKNNIESSELTLDLESPQVTTDNSTNVSDMYSMYPHFANVTDYILSNQPYIDISKYYSKE